jgi:hypothetical protein
MFSLRTTLSERWFYIFPPLIAIYPIIFLYSHNVQELLISQLYAPVVVALIVTILCWVCLSFFLKDSLKAGVIVTIFIVFFYSYGTLFDWLVSLNLFTVKHRHILPVFLLIAAYLGYFVYRIKNADLFHNTAKILTVMVSVLIILSIITALPYEFEKIESSHQNIASTENPGVVNQSFVTNASEYPDIYYIILDEYASSSTIKEIWGYDNSEFENFLKEKGFYIASNSSVRKADTLFSISSNLNMGYVDENADTLTLFSKINNNQVMQYLKNRGYSTIVIDGIKTNYPNKGTINADYDYTFNSSVDQEKVIINENDGFTNIFIQKTLLKAFSYKLEQVSYIRDYNRFENLYVFEKSRSIGYNITPKFVYIHINSPHAPFVFDSNGNYVDPKNSVNWKEKKYYLGQYIYTTHQTEQIVNNLLLNSKNDSIIIIQSDHGPRPNNSPHPEQNIEIPKQNSLKVFNALYLPDGSGKYLYTNISPVNTFRFIFNHTFHDDFKLLEDA